MVNYDPTTVAPAQVLPLQDLPSTATPVTAAYLNHVHSVLDDIASASGRISDLEAGGVGGGGGGTGLYVSGYVPSGSTTPTVTHSLATEDLASVLVYRVSDGAITPASWQIVDANSVQLTFSSAPTDSQYRYRRYLVGAVKIPHADRDVATP
jgi:hypothetical protein